LRAEITQREQAEEELLRARKLESLGVLAGGIAHDFNNFLTVVQGNIEVAKVHLQCRARRPGNFSITPQALASARNSYLLSC
jgi:signal transduction histidine kinase